MGPRPGEPSPDWRPELTRSVGCVCGRLSYNPKREEWSFVTVGDGVGWTSIIRGDKAWATKKLKSGRFEAEEVSDDAAEDIAKLLAGIAICEPVMRS